MFAYSSSGVPSFGDLSYKAPVALATVAALPAYTVAGNVLTAAANGALPAIDGIAPLAGYRVLLRNGAAGADNGLYVVTSLGDATHPWVLTRAPDATRPADCVQGASCYVLFGVLLGGTTWVASAAWTVNVTDPAFVSSLMRANTSGFAWATVGASGPSTSLAIDSPVGGNPSLVLRQGAVHTVLGQLDLATGLQLGAGAGLDTAWSRTAAGTWTAQALGAAATVIVALAQAAQLARFRALVSGDTSPRFELAGDATLAGWQLGPGNAAADVRARRSAAATLQLDNGAAASLTLLDLIAAPIKGATPIVRVYSATTTWSIPAGLLFATVEVQGAGGAGGGASSAGAGNQSVGAGGGAGGFARKLILASALSGSYTVTVGAGGTGVSGAAGNAGNLSSFAGAGITTIQGTGGTGGGTGPATASTVPSNPPGTGGGGTGGDVGVNGGDGQAGFASATGGAGGQGGASYHGGGGLGGSVRATTSNSAGAGGEAYGSGGGGSVSLGTAAALAGGAGKGGLIVVTEFYGP